MSGDVAAQGADFWEPLRRTTQARIGLGRSGDSLPTRHLLEFRAAHAAARDAVHEPLDVAALQAQLDEPAHVVSSRASSRSEYLRRPDLGREPADLFSLPAPPPGSAAGPDLAIVLADGLSARALSDHGAATYAALRAAMPGLTFAAPVIALQARVALGDHIGAALGARAVLVLIGERPGLSVADSIGVYLTHAPRPGRTDADRNCVSNVHPPHGMSYDAAARTVASLVLGARELGRSGVDLKDTSRDSALDSAPGGDGGELGQ